MPSQVRARGRLRPLCARATACARDCASVSSWYPLQARSAAGTEPPARRPACAAGPPWAAAPFSGVDWDSDASSGSPGPGPRPAPARPPAPLTASESSRRVRGGAGGAGPDRRRWISRDAGAVPGHARARGWRRPEPPPEEHRPGGGRCQAQARKAPPLGALPVFAMPGLFPGGMPWAVHSRALGLTLWKFVDCMYCFEPSPAQCCPANCLRVTGDSRGATRTDSTLWFGFGSESATAGFPLCQFIYHELSSTTVFKL